MMITVFAVAVNLMLQVPVEPAVAPAPVETWQLWAAVGAGAALGVVELPLLLAATATTVAVLPPFFGANIWRGAGSDAKLVFVPVAIAGGVGIAVAALIPLAELGLMRILGVEGLSPWVPMVIGGGAGVLGTVMALGAMSLIKTAADVPPAAGVVAVVLTAATVTSVVAGPLWWSSHPAAIE